MTERRFPPLVPAGPIAPWFQTPALAGNPRHAFDAVAVRAVLILFQGSAGSPRGFPRIRHFLDQGHRRRFTATLNLDAEDSEDGELNFPEFGPRLCKSATGSALKFSCSLLHRALPAPRSRHHAAALVR